MNNNFFHFQEDKDSDRLVVIFSGVNAKSFMGYKLVEEFECNKIFIRDENRSWYHSKIENISENIDELVLYIKRFTDRFKKEKITFIGSSMGAYAALLIGIKLDIGKIIAFGPQIYINKNFPNNPKDDSYILYKDLTSLINSSRSNIEIFVGVNELADLYHVKSIENKKHVKVYKIFSQPHNVMFFLHKIELLKEYVTCRVFDKSCDIDILNNFETNFNEDGYLEKAVELFYIDKNYDLAQGYFEQLIKSYPSINTFWKFKAMCSFYQDEFVKAIELFKISQEIVFKDDESHYYLGLCYFYLKEYFSAHVEFKYALEFATDKKLSYYIKLAVSLRELQRYDEALEVLNNSLKVSSKNFGTYYQIAQIYKRQNKTALALENLKLAKELSPENKIVLEELKELSK